MLAKVACPSKSDFPFFLSHPLNALNRKFLGEKSRGIESKDGNGFSGNGFLNPNARDCVATQNRKQINKKRDFSPWSADTRLAAGGLDLTPDEIAACATRVCTFFDKQLTFTTKSFCNVKISIIFIRVLKDAWYIFFWAILMWHFVIKDKNRTSLK